MSQFSVIIVDNVESGVRELIHVAVKTHATDWWHEFPDVWIVKSDRTVNWWQERLDILFGISGSLLVLGLPQTPSDRSIGFLLRTSTKSSNWLEGIYQERPVDDPWGAPPPTKSGPVADDEPPF